MFGSTSKFCVLPIIITVKVPCFKHFCRFVIFSIKNIQPKKQREENLQGPEFFFFLVEMRPLCIPPQCLYVFIAAIQFIFQEQNLFLLLT